MSTKRNYIKLKVKSLDSVMIKTFPAKVFGITGTAEHCVRDMNIEYVLLFEMQ